MPFQSDHIFGLIVLSAGLAVMIIFVISIVVGVVLDWRAWKNLRNQKRRIDFERLGRKN